MNGRAQVRWDAYMRHARAQVSCITVILTVMVASVAVEVTTVQELVQILDVLYVLKAQVLVDCIESAPCCQ